MTRDLIHVLSPQQLTSIVIVGSCLLAFTLIALTAIVCSTRQSARNAAHRAGLVREMLDRGLSADDIALVLTAGDRADARPADAQTLPHPSEVLVEKDGEWLPAYVLEVGGGRYHVHFHGTESSDNEWVPAARLRFPAGSNLPQLAAADQRPVKEPMFAEI